jgi:hypothetical protein
MESISRETLQKKLGIGFGEAGKLASKIEKFKYTKPMAKIEIGYLESDDITKLVLTLEFKKRNK